MSERDMYALDLDASLRGKILHEHYRVERKAAQGGMAWMFQVTHTMFNETMALKLLYPHLTDDPRIRKRFIDEAKIQFRLKHPNIVNVTEIIQAGRLLGIVQEWVHGSSLKDYLRGCRSLLTLPQIRFILSPILDALHTAHEQGVIHRDIKPANILLAGRQLDVPLVPKLTDFGVAKVLDELDDRTATGVLIGTFKFTSPEQIKESKAVDRRADIYSIGVMLYQLCTGQFPFTGGVQKVLIKHLMDPPEPPDSINPDLPSEVSQLILRCLEKEPEARFNSCYDLNEALKEAIPEEEPVFPHKTHRRPRPNERTSTGPVFTPLPLGSLGEEEGDNALSQRPYLDAKERGDSKSDISMNSASDPVEPQSAWTSNSILNELLGEEELPKEPSLPSAPPTDPANEKPLLSASPFLEGPPTSPFSGMMGEFQSSDEYFEDDAPTEVGSYQPPMVEPLHPEPAPALDEKRYDSWEIDKITSEAALSESLLEGGEEMPVLSLKIELEEPPEVEPAPDDSDPVPSGFEGGLFDESVDGQGALPDAPPEEANTSGMRQADAQAEPVGTPGTLPPEAPHTLDGPDLKAPSPSGENLWEQWQERVEHDDATAQEPRFDSREMEAAINRPGRQRTLLLLILLAAVVLWFFFGN